MAVFPIKNFLPAENLHSAVRQVRLEAQSAHELGRRASNLLHNIMITNYYASPTFESFNGKLMNNTIAKK